MRTKAPPTATDRLRAYAGIGRYGAELILGLEDPRQPIAASYFNYGTGQTCNKLATLLKHGLARWVVQGKTVKLTDRALRAIEGEGGQP